MTHFRLYLRSISILFTVFLFLFVVHHVYAISDPLSVTNNKYGIHIVDTNDVAEAATLVNSTGGSWGYVTLVIPETDRNVEKWQGIFNQMRRLKVIPIVRLATSSTNGAWSIPRDTTFNEWVDFLNKLNWVVENRYIVLFNEPNHAGEWGNTVNPEEYAKVFVTLGKKLKEASPNFFLLPAGLDVSAATGGESLNAAEYIARMLSAEPDMASLMDGWTSHAYPNPAFSGSPFATGKGSIRSFDWELAQLRQHGVQKNLPIFITETGWEHSEGKYYERRLLPSATIATYLKQAAVNVWSDPRIVAITPFLLNYQDYPFDHFSWRKLGSGEYHEEYFAYKNIEKLTGTPKQHFDMSIGLTSIPTKLITNSTYTLTFELQNHGQTIFNTNEGDSIALQTDSEEISTFIDSVAAIEPGDKRPVTFHVKTPTKAGSHTLRVMITTQQGQLNIGTLSFIVIPPPALHVKTVLGWKKYHNASDTTILLYDGGTLLQKYEHLDMLNGNVTVEGVSGIIPGAAYRVVLLVPGYLPRQHILTIQNSETSIDMKRMFPLDTDGDGSFSYKDILGLMQLSPRAVIRLFFGR